MLHNTGSSSKSNSRTSGSSYTKTPEESESVAEETKKTEDTKAYSDEDKSIINFAAEIINKRGIQDDDAAMKELFVFMEQNGTVTNKQRAMLLEYFIT